MEEGRGGGLASTSYQQYRLPVITCPGTPGWKPDYEFYLHVPCTTCFSSALLISHNSLHCHVNATK